MLSKIFLERWGQKVFFKDISGKIKYRTGIVKPIVSIMENKQRARQTPQKMDEG